MYVVPHLQKWGPHNHKKDRTGHGFIDSLGKLKLCSNTMFAMTRVNIMDVTDP